MNTRAWCGLETLEPRLMLSGAPDPLAMISRAFIDRADRQLADGSLVHDFDLGFYTSTDGWLSSARFRTPNGQWYSIATCEQVPADGGQGSVYEWSYTMEAPDASALRNFTAGTYLLEMTPVGGQPTTTGLVYDGTAAPVQPTVVLDLVLDPRGAGTFDIMAEATGPGGGLSFYAVYMDGFATLVNLGPRVNALVSDGVSTSLRKSGFDLTFGRSADNTSPLSGMQDFTDPARTVHGFGQTPGDLTGGRTIVTDFGSVQTTYGAPLLLGSGTYVGAAPVIGETGFNVYVSAQGTSTTSAATVLGRPALMKIDQVPEFIGLDPQTPAATALTLTWEAVTDSDVTGIALEILGPGDSQVCHVDLPANATSYGPVQLAYSTQYRARLDFRRDSDVLTSVQGASYRTHTFTSREVSFTTTSVVDLSAAVNSVSFSSPALLGSSGAVNYTVLNTGLTRVQGDVAVKFYLSSDHALSDADVLIGSRTLALALDPGQTSDYSATLTLPTDGVVNGNYYVLAMVDADDAVAEGDETNNVAASASTISVAASDLAGVFGRVSLPTAVVAGRKLTGKVTVIVANLGNLSLPSGQLVNVTLVARSLGDQTEVELGRAANQSVSLLKPGASKTVTVKVNLLTGLPSGHYAVEAHITPVGALPEESLDNNLVTEDRAVNTYAIVSADPFVDLTAAIGAKAVVPAAAISGNGTKIRLPVAIANGGNVPIARDTKIDVEVFARPVSAADDDSHDVLLGKLSQKAVGNLGAGKSKTLTPTVYLPLGLPADEYRIVANVDSGGAVDESDETNNSAIAAGHVDVTRGYVDPAGMFGAVGLPATLLSSHKIAGKVQVVLKNLGNVALAAGQKVTVQLFAIAASDASEYPLTLAVTQSVGKLGPNKSKTVTLSVNLLLGLPADEYRIEARIVPVGALTEEDAGNNIVTVNALSVTPTIVVVD